MFESIIQGLQEAVEDAQSVRQLKRDVIRTEDTQEASGGPEEQIKKQATNANAVKD